VNISDRRRILIQHVKADVLVAWTWAAGMRAAIEASGQGAEVTILAKGPIRATHMRTSEGQLNAVSGRNPLDCRDILFSDAINGGIRLNAALSQKFPPSSARATSPWRGAQPRVRIQP
jgi:succinate dehydrogenase/fumarate reductase flavoprotein subunit